MRKVRLCAWSLSKLLGVPSLIYEVYATLEVVVIGGGGDTDTGGGISTSFAWRIFIMKNNFDMSLLVTHVAST
jgi:hypothetical protein